MTAGNDASFSGDPLHHTVYGGFLQRIPHLQCVVKGSRPALDRQLTGSQLLNGLIEPQEQTVMDKPQDFAEILQAFIAQARHSKTSLAELAGIPIGTIENWTDGTVRRPRWVRDVLKVAQALA